ncbi:hypothetical protein D3C87_1361350 [compost metagenome]
MDAADRVLAHDAGAAMDADGLLADLQRGFGGDQLHLGSGGGIQPVLVDQPRAVVHHPARRLDVGGHVGQLVGHGLVVADALAGHDPVFGKRLGRIERGARHPKRVGRNAHAVFAQALQQQGIGPRAFAHQAIVGHESVFDMNQRGLGAADAFLAQLVDIKTLVRQVHDEEADRIGLEFGRRARRHHEKVGDRRIGDVELAAAELPAAFDLFRLGRHGPDVGPAVGFAQREARDLAARQRGLEVALFLAFGADLPDWPDRQMRLRRPARRESLAHVAELFAHDAVADLVHVAAAVRRRVAHAQQPQLAPALEYMLGKVFVLFGLVHQGRQFFAAQPTHGVAHRFMFGRKGEIEAHTHPNQKFS